MSVYIIRCKLNKKIVYVGSCKSLKIRKQTHKNAYDKWINNKIRLPCEMYKYFNQYGYDNFDYIIYKNYNFSDNKFLKSREQLLMNKLRRYKCLIVVNKCDSFTTPYIQKLKLKLYNKSQSGRWYDNTKIWVQNNKERYRLQRQNYYKNKKNKK